ncbi:deoxyribodipyrimidine photo-lyase-like isoform X2 [Panulirus ornatus]|uniref:deoxyribodipyrimidine photo-lyase-like isoform X2 n=1 Tax=Panulirus ornatus TaxID=150431 RepID=UPI003A8B84F3
MSVVGKTQPKKIKLDDESLEIHPRLQKEREKEAENITEFKFNKKRVKMMSEADEVPDCDGIVYWMFRDQRVQDNWALLFAQRLALKSKVSLHVVFCLVPKFLDSTIRHYHFMLKGLEEVESECQMLNIEFHLLLGEAKDVLPKFIEKHHIGGLVADFSPLRLPRQWVEDVKKAIPETIPMCRPVDWTAAENSLEVEMTVKPVEWAVPGTHAGLDTLNEFCLKRLRKYANHRNDPNVKAISDLSPWLHFGQISAQRCVLEVKRYKKQLVDGVNGFIEETVIRRELSENFCYYQKNYDRIDGAYKWAITTLNDHKKDKRAYLYSRETFIEARTHDDLWNSAQIQLVKEGKIHGFMRMYWAKKILEWTASPEEALKTAIFLNDTYSLDGNDPNGYVGCMWSICGIHDQGWGERPIFGKIRYMNYDGCKRKFKIDSYIAQYGGKKHKYSPPS